jgi:hypothetical protein
MFAVGLTTFPPPAPALILTRVRTSANTFDRCMLSSAAKKAYWAGRPARVKLHGKKREHGHNSYDFGRERGDLVRLRYGVAVYCVQSWHPWPSADPRASLESWISLLHRVYATEKPALSGSLISAPIARQRPALHRMAARTNPQPVGTTSQSMKSYPTINDKEVDHAQSGYCPIGG